MKSKIVVVKVENLKKHPQANKLQICSANTGSESFQIVCGAKNISEGMLTILAMPGATLPNGKSIQPAQLRGIDSHGMLCSALDLSIAEEKGIIDLPATTELGISFDKLDKDLLSSTPWHRFKLVDTHWFIPSEKRIQVLDSSNHDGTQEPGWSCISKTYFDGENYRYRHFNSSIS